MSLVVIGINQTTADVAVREMLAIGEHQVLHALDQLVCLDSVAEAAIVSTCNRTELYAVVSPAISDPEDLLIDFLSEWHGVPRNLFEHRVYSYRDGDAASHLFSVAAGLDSMILGEPDIQRQVKQALVSTQAAGVAGPVINRLFQDALVAGKRARTETGISRGASSVGAVAVERATQIFGDTLAGCTVLILGAGKMSEVTAKHLHARGAPAVVVANRTHEKAMQLASQFGGTARRFDELPQALVSADIVVCSTAAPHPVVTRPLIKEAMRARHNRELFLIDIAVPRDVEPAVGDMENVYLYNIDDLNQLVAGARQARAGEVIRARELIDNCVAEFLHWLHSLEVTPLVSAVRERLAGLRETEMDRLRSRLPGLSDNEIAVVAASLEALTNKIAHPAMVTIKESVRPGGNPGALETVRRAFGVEGPLPVPMASRELAGRITGKKAIGRCPGRDVEIGITETGGE
ncbi:MAG: glutamyl-tRNA reductase [Capsulimonadaceae bacterium]